MVNLWGDWVSVAEGKTRITVTLGNGVLAMLDDACARSGLSRSAEISRIVQDALEMRALPETTPEQMIEFLRQVIAQRDS